uniref:Uncharacterized protein n=1 Tax=Anopheles culicifacies TaxID=139723 RepID=A0A182MX32_9DIPT
MAVRCLLVWSLLVIATASAAGVYERPPSMLTPEPTPFSVARAKGKVPQEPVPTSSTPCPCKGRSGGYGRLLKGFQLGRPYESPALLANPNGREWFGTALVAVDDESSLTY